jgi:hypothetical protein
MLAAVDGATDGGGAAVVSPLVASLSQAEPASTVAPASTATMARRIRRILVVGGANLAEVTFRRATRPTESDHRDTNSPPEPVAGRALCPP